MDVEFHYYMTYLIATRAGFSPHESATIAYAAQYVDDNDLIFEIDSGGPSAYHNYISQTVNILKPKRRLMRIYPLFHFIPGNPMATSARRRDGKLHLLNTTPNSPNANWIIDAALATDSLYRIGIAAHAYADTWAHQNFIGYFDPFNAMAEPLAEAIPNIGHADALHQPDQPAVVWEDQRLLDPAVDNRARFLDAAAHLYRKLRPIAAPGILPEQMAPELKGLIDDLDAAIGDPDPYNDLRDARIGRYRQLAEQDEYGATALVSYDWGLWFEAAINEQVRGLRDRSENWLNRLDPFTDRYTWRDPEHYRETDWHRFQEAVKTHQDNAWGLLADSVFSHMDLREL